MWHAYISAVEARYRRTSKQSQGALEVCRKNVECLNNARLPCRSQSIRIASANENGASTQANSFDDVTAAANAAIHQNFELTICRGHNLRKNT